MVKSVGLKVYQQLASKAKFGGQDGMGTHRPNSFLAGLDSADNGSKRNGKMN